MKFYMALGHDNLPYFDHNLLLTNSALFYPYLEDIIQKCSVHVIIFFNINLTLQVKFLKIKKNSDSLDGITLLM